MLSDMLEQEFQRWNITDKDIPEIINCIADSIPFNIPYRMKLAISVSEAVTWASHFRIPIQHWNDTIVPINAIMVVIAKSGAAKDSSLRAARECFKDSYEQLSRYRAEQAKNKAIQLATEAGKENPSAFADYKEFYKTPPPLFAGISTGEGLVQHLNDLEREKLGAGYLYAGELASELQSNPNIGEMLKSISELYDLGHKELKLLKDRSSQLREVRSMPMSALFQTSQDMVIYDNEVKRRFRIEFSSKLARRSFFVFLNDPIVEQDFPDIKALIAYEKSKEDKAKQSRIDVSQFVSDLTGKLCETLVRNLTVSDKVREMFIVYQKYNEEQEKCIDRRFPLTRLTRRHLQWKALKLSGALCILDFSTNIKEHNFRAAIRFNEVIADDIRRFEEELQKEPYELCSDYLRNYAVEGKNSMSLHEMRKMGFSTANRNMDNQLMELSRLMNSYDDTGIYKPEKEGMSYQKINHTETCLLSWLECKGSKEERAHSCAVGYTCEELTFKDIGEMLKGDYAYSPFKFRNGQRGRQNIISPCKWIVMDIDKSLITDEECHLILCDLNHYVVRTSNPDNAYRYRVILELDMEVDISDVQWPKFIKAIGEDLGLKPDSLAKSQIFFSYSERNILSTVDQKPIETKPYMSVIADVKEPPLPSSTEKSQRLNNPMDTFDKAFNARDGEGRKKIWWSIMYAKELGGDRDYCHKLIDDINAYWVKPLGLDDMATFHRQIDRIYGS